MAPSTPTRKAIMPPPPPHSAPGTPSNALVFRRSSGPLVPAAPPGCRDTPVTRPRHTVTVQVKEERGVTPSPSTPRRASSAFPTPPSTSLVRRSRSITPSPKRRRASSTPSRSRAPALSSSSAFKAKLAELRSRTLTRRNQYPGSGSSDRPARNRSATVEDDEDDDEVEFWGGGKVKGSSADAAIEIDADSDDSSPSPSPTPSIRGTVENRTLVRPTPFTDRAGSRSGPSKDERFERAESTFSLASFGSRTTPFVRAPTWDDSDPRYGRTYPKDGPSREVAPSAPNVSSISPSIPLPFTSAIEKMCDLLASLQAISTVDTKIKSEDKHRMGLEDRAVCVLDSFLNDDEVRNDDGLLKRLKDELIASNIDIPSSEIFAIVRFFKSAIHQILKSSIAEYKDEQRYKGNKDVRQNMWFNDFRIYLKFTIPTFGDKIDKDIMEDILSCLKTVLYQKEVMISIAHKLDDMFDDCNIPKTRKLLNALIDLSASIANVAFSK